MESNSELTELVEAMEDPVLKAKAQQLLKLPPRMSAKGMVSRVEENGRVSWVSYKDATARGATGTPENRIVERRVKGDIPGLTPIVKRSDRERVESLSRRFWDQIQTNPAMAPLLLQEIREEYWKSGNPITYEEIKQAAIKLLKKAADEAKNVKK